MDFPEFFLQDIQAAHSSWREILYRGLCAVHKENPEYLPSLALSSFLPTKHRLFSAFSIPRQEVRYVLVGEGPYPREESATGYCFMDGAVDGLWSSDVNGGLSTSVNRATSLRNFIKMLLVADQQMSPSCTSGVALVPVAQKIRSMPEIYIQTMSQLQTNFLRQGFLMLNASLVFRPEVAPIVDARAWMIFMQEVFHCIAQQEARPTLILWGKIADKLAQIEVLRGFVSLRSEHPYNLSFITNSLMQELFAPMKLLQLSK